MRQYLQALFVVLWCL